MLYLVGLGLADETDITVKGLEIVKRAERVYLEAYTSILMVKKEKLVSVESAVSVTAAKTNWTISRNLSTGVLLLRQTEKRSKAIAMRSSKVPTRRM